MNPHYVQQLFPSFILIFWTWYWIIWVKNNHDIHLLFDRDTQTDRQTNRVFFWSFALPRMSFFLKFCPPTHGCGRFYLRSLWLQLSLVSLRSGWHYAHCWGKQALSQGPCVGAAAKWKELVILIFFSSELWFKWALWVLKALCGGPQMSKPADSNPSSEWAALCTLRG